MIAVAIVCGPKLWNARFTAPRRVNVQGPGTLDLSGTRVQFPIKRETIQSFYVLDGGTYGVRFVDNAGVRHVVTSWHRWGDEEHQGDIIIGEFMPEMEGTANIGKVPDAERLIFSLVELEYQSVSPEDQLHLKHPTLMQVLYPRTADYVGRVLPPRLAYRLGLW